MSIWRYNTFTHNWEQTNTWSFVSRFDLNLSEIDENSVENLSFSDDFSYITQEFEHESFSDEEPIENKPLYLKMLENEYENRHSAPAA
jgi:hypothetical protein